MRIDISIPAYQKMMTAVTMTQKEVSGYGTVSAWVKGERLEWQNLRQVPEEREYDIIFYVEDVWPLDHGSWAETEIDPAVAMKFYTERLREGYQPQDFKLWWHRHPLSAGWSATDEYCIRHTPMGNSMAPERTGWMISLVWCTHTGWNGRFDQLANPGFTIHVPVTIQGHEAVEPDVQKFFHTTVRVEQPRSAAFTHPRHYTGAWNQPSLLVLDDDDLPWVDFARSEAEEIADNVETALTDITWMDGDVDAALSFISWLHTTIKNHAERQGIDQDEIEYFASQGIRQFRLREYREQILEAIRWA